MVGPQGPLAEQHSEGRGGPPCATRNRLDLGGAHRRAGHRAHSVGLWERATAICDQPG